MLALMVCLALTVCLQHVLGVSGCRMLENPRFLGVARYIMIIGIVKWSMGEERHTRLGGSRCVCQAP